MALSIGEDPVGDALFIGGILFAVWGAATVVRSRHELAEALAARTVELEHEREEKAKLAVAEERARVARELHDVVAHNLSIMVVQAGAERRALGDERPRPPRCSRRSSRPAAPRWPRCGGCSACCAAPTTSSRSRRSRASSTSTTSSAQVREAGLPVELRVEGERARAAAAGSTSPPTGSCRRR